MAVPVDVLTVSEAGRLLGMTPSGVRWLAVTNQLPVAQMTPLGRLFNRADVRTLRDWRAREPWAKRPEWFPRPVVTPLGR